jgi:putative glutamine amidotransferase
MIRMKPRIAIPVPNSDPEYSARTLPEYKAAVEACGGEAVEIPLGLSNSEIAQRMKHCDAVLLPGSPADLDPQKYGAERHKETAETDTARDNVDELLLQDAFNMHKPLLGICYGLQSINVWRTGTLVQDIESEVNHTRPKGVEKSVKIEHEITVQPLSRLADAISPVLQVPKVKPFKMMVNSSHHQAVDVVGDDLKVVARSKRDHVIEALEGVAKDHWVVGVQWHPERTFSEDAPSRAIFAVFVEAARKWHERAAKKSTDFETVREA